jgi:YjbE family integral membrane protein
MDLDTIVHYLGLTLEVFYLDLLLSGDNALVIAIACRSLPPERTRRAMMIGIQGAVALRIGLTTMAGLLLHIPLLKLVGGIALTGIAVKLTIEEAGERKSGKAPSTKPGGMWSAVGTIVVADLVMSVDNVVALASVAQGSIFVLAAGLLMSVPLLMYGSLFVTALLRRYPLLKRAGGALLGWLAGAIAISDPLITDWISQQAPALTIVVPILTVVFVLVESRIMEKAQAAALEMRPKRGPQPAIADSRSAVIEEAPARAVIASSTRTVAAIVASPESAAKSLDLQPSPQSVATDPLDEPVASRPQPPPRNKRFNRSFWIVAVISLVVLWLLFKLFSLDFEPAAPALQFTHPR